MITLEEIFHVNIELWIIEISNFLMTLVQFGNNSDFISIIYLKNYDNSSSVHVQIRNSRKYCREKILSLEIINFKIFK